MSKNQNKTIGRVIGETNSNYFKFTVKEKQEPPVFEYIKINITEDSEEKQVLAQVTKISREDPAMHQGTPIEAVETMRNEGVSNTQTLATAEVIGYLSTTGVKKPRHAPKPGQKVQLAENQFLEQFTTVENGLDIGSILTRKEVKGNIDISGLNRHLAILAATGSGKSHTTGVIIEELLEKGGTILAIDPHGDYTQMNQEQSGENFEYTENVRVFKARSPGDEEYQIKVKTSRLGWRKLCTLANIQEDFTNQRSLVRKIVKKIKEEEGDNYKYTLDDIIEKLEQVQDHTFPINTNDDGDNKSETVETADKVQFKFERLQRYNILGASDINFQELVSPQQLSVLDLSGVPFEAQDLIAEVILERIYEARLRNELGEKGENYEYPIFTVIEEAHRLCPAANSSKNPRSKEKISEIASEGRKFGTYLTLISQRPSKIDEDTLSQCNSMIVQRIVNPKDQNSIKAASESMAGSMIDELPGLNVGEAIVTGPAVEIPSVVKIRGRKTVHGGEDIEINDKLDKARKEREREDKTTDKLDSNSDSLNV